MINHAKRHRNSKVVLISLCKKFMKTKETIYKKTQRKIECFSIALHHGQSLGSRNSIINIMTRTHRRCCKFVFLKYTQNFYQIEWLCIIISSGNVVFLINY